MSTGSGPSPASKLGRVPKILAAVPVATLCVTGIVHAQRTQPMPVSAGTISGGATSATPTPLPAPTVQAPALEVTAPEQSPASVWSPGLGTSVKVASAASAWSDVPSVAQVAYQRAASVINSASTTCHLDWSLLAAVGKVESDHGRSGGAQLSDLGVAAPAIIGPVLDGTGPTALVTDTDGGSLDGDPTFDRAIGPMQFLPATWSAVGVDGDGDGVRNPQDIDDAALAAAVYLCAGGDDLSTSVGQSAALLRYNPSATYADSVMRAARTYQAGFSTVTPAPSFSVAAVSARVGTDLLPGDDASDAESQTLAAQKHSKKKSMKASTATTVAADSGQKDVAPTAGPTPGGQTPPPGPTPGPDDETGDGTPGPSTGPEDGPGEQGNQGGDSGPSDGGSGSTGPSDESSTGPSAGGTPAVAATADEIADLCGAELAKAFPNATAVARDEAASVCAKALSGKTKAEAESAVRDLLKGLPATIAGLEEIA